MIIYCDYPNINSTGANLCYHDVSNILKNQEDTKSVSFEQLKAYMKEAKDEDTIFPNCGIYDWFFVWLRKKYGKRCKIIRDVHTTLWSGYLLQEALCSGRTQEGDMLFFPSEYTRQVYIKFFPHLNSKNTAVCFPTMSSFPKMGDRKEKDTDTINIAWLGTLSKEKNFNQVLDIFAHLSNEVKDTSFNLNVCGRFSSEEFSPMNVKNTLRKNNVSQMKYTHYNNGNPIEHNHIWNFLKEQDILLFPSTANLESFPRIILEATHSKIPIILSDYAGGYSVIPQSNLISTTYFPKTSDLINNQPLGIVNIQEAADMIDNFNSLKLGDSSKYKKDKHILFDLVRGNKYGERFNLDKKTKRFIDNITLSIDASFSPHLEKAANTMKKIDILNIGNSGYELAKELNFKVFAELSR